MLLTILSNLQFHGQQAIALRGDGDESSSNFQQLLRLRAEDNPKITEWLERKCDTYTSPEIQNKMLKIMGLQILRGIANDIQSARFFTLMADETTDASNQSQFVVVIGGYATT